MGNDTSTSIAAPNSKQSCSIVVTPPSSNYAEFFEELLLSEREKSIIQKSWTLSEQLNLLNLGQRLFEKIFINEPESIKVFQSTPESSSSPRFVHNQSFYRHIRAFMNLMEFVISKIDDDDRGEKLWRTCFEVGKRHVRFRDQGFRPEYWHTFEISMLQCVHDWEQNQWSQRSQDAWTKLIAYIVRNIRSGYDYELARVNAIENSQL